MMVKELNRRKSTRHCLKCGKPMWTDRCHRICTHCAHDNDGLTECHVAVGPEVLQFLRSLSRHGLMAHEAVPRETAATAED